MGVTLGHSMILPSQSKLLLTRIEATGTSRDFVSDFPLAVNNIIDNY